MFCLSTLAELLNDDYVFNSKLKVATVTDNGRTFTVSGETKAKEDLDAELGIKHKLGSGTLTTKLFTSGRAEGELKLDNFALDGLTTTLTFGVGKKVGVTKLEYSQGRVGLTALGDYYEKKVNASATAILTSNKMNGFGVIGAESGYDVEKGEAGDLNMACSYFDGRESEISLHVQQKGAKGKLCYSHQVRPDFAVAGQMDYNREKDTAVLTIGGAAKLDGATTIKGKVNSTGQLALTYLQVIRPKTTLTLSSTFDVKEMKSAKMGVSLAIE